MINPIMGVAVKATHILEWCIEVFQEPPPESSELVTTLPLPNRVKAVLNFVQEIFWSLIPSKLIPMVDRYPDLLTNSKPISCMVWNVQGADNKEFLATLKELLRINNPSVFALVETHVSSDHAERICKCTGYSDCLSMDAVGYSGGIWVFWKKDETKVTVNNNSSQHITVVIERNGEEPWFFSAIYASPDLIKRNDLWREISDMVANTIHPWLLAGDFNETKNLSERHGGGPDMQRRGTNFNNLIENDSLIDLGYSGPHYTWARGPTPDTRK